MLSNKDINFNDESQVLTINGEKHPIGEAIAEKIGDLTETGLTGDTVSAQLTSVNESLGLLRGEKTILAINDDAVKGILTNSTNGVVKICIINPSTSGDDTPFTGHAYVLISAKYSHNLGMQYAISLADMSNKKRLYTGTWTSWA